MSRANAALARSMRETGRPATRLSNEALLTAVQAGDPAAIAAMISANAALVVRKSRAYLQSRPHLAHLSDDMIGEGFVALTEAVHRLAKAKQCDAPNATGYISIAVDGAFKSVAVESPFSGSPRTNKRRIARGEHVPQSVTTEERYYDPRPLADLRGELEAVCESNDDREILRMREAGFSDLEIGRALKISTTSVFAARKAIEKRFNERNQ